MLVYYCDELLPLRYTNLDFQSDRDSCKSTSSFMFTLGGGAISKRSVKQAYIFYSTMEAKYVVAYEVAKEVICL